MSEWIRHRGSKTMPKRLEGVRFEARFRDGSIHKGETIEFWDHQKQEDDVMGYRITGEHYNAKPFAVVEIVTCSQSNDTYDLQWHERDTDQTNKYQRTIKGVTVDVYDVLVAFGVTCPAMAHAIKKMLMPGQRGSKDADQDKREAIQAIERSIELAKGGE